MTLEKYLAELGVGDMPPSHSGLLQLSGLTPEEVAQFKAAWTSLPQSRRCEILTVLSELSEDNLELDFTAVFRASLTDEDDEVRERATRGLWECDDRAIIRPLIQLLKSDPSANVRSAATLTLGKFADMAQNGKVLSRDAERIRTALLSSINEDEEDPDVKRRAIEAVASFNSPEIEELIQEAYDSGDLKLVQSAIYAMGRTSDSRWLATVLDETHHDDPSIRYEAATACAQLGDETTVPHLMRLIKDEDFQVQLSAVSALGAIGGPLAKRALLQCLKAGEDGLEEAAQTALDSIEFEEDPLGFRFSV